MSKQISQSNASPSQNAICEETFNQLIAVAGRQRMLSQRLGLSLMLAASSSGEGAEASFDQALEMAGAVLEQFRASHEAILQEVSGTAERKRVFAITNACLFADGAGGASAELKRFLSQAEQHISSARSAGALDLQSVRKFADYIMQGLLACLEEIVGSIQKDCETFLEKTRQKRDEDSREVIRCVDEIVSAAAFSRMIALNAKISAARAGEYGAEFSALTNEIKDVSERISQSSESIRSRLQG